MAALDFPTSPTVGQTYPSPPVAGVPVYTWNGVTWNTIPSTAKVPVYTDGSTAMTAALTLSGLPVNPTDAADKAYVDSKTIPSGTIMLFLQSAAPTGWTRVNANDDSLLRCVGSATPASGGTNGFVATFNTQTTTAGFTITTTYLPTLTATQVYENFASGTATGISPASGGSTAMLQNAPTITGSSTAHTHGITTAIKYVDVLQASKN